MCLKWKAPVPVELIIWELVAETGWTLDYISSLPTSALWEWMNVRDGKNKAGR